MKWSSAFLLYVLLASSASVGFLLPGGLAAQAITEFSAGITPGARPLGIVAGPDGNLWFTEKAGDRIGRITPAGVVTEFSDGLQPGSQPADITVGPDGNLWFTEPGTDRIGRITPDGVITEFGAGITPGAQPNRMATGDDGNVWFTEPGANRIGRISPAGVVTEFSIPASGTLTGITRGPDGNMWFAQLPGLDPEFPVLSSKIGWITPDGAVNYLRPLSRSTKPLDLINGPDGSLWYSYNNTEIQNGIVRIAPPMTFDIAFPASSSMFGGLTTGPDGNVWFADVKGTTFPQFQMDRIGRITSSGIVTEFLFGTKGKPSRIAAGPDDNLWFTEYDGDRIGRITPSTTAVEFYNANLDHYFITWMTDEITKLDAGSEIKGWTRTGYSFRVYTIQQSTMHPPSTGPGVQPTPIISVPVCRYYIPPQLGDSHFFGRDVAECEATGRQFPELMLEDKSFMQMFLPLAGICPDNTTPVYRVFSNRADANHRYMTDRAVRDQMVAQGWIAEGDGPDRVVMCAPQ